MRLLLVPLAFSLLAQAGNVSWASPSVGDIFGPGDTMIARWTSDRSIASPAFRLCESNASVSVHGSASCGSAVSPFLQQSAGSYFISLSIPNVTDEAGFYLQMEDDQGKKIESPNFSLSPVPVISNHTSALTNSTQLAPQLAPDPSLNHVPPPTAAFAIPLSFVAAILIGSFVLCLHNRRKLKQERILDAQKLSSTKDKVHLMAPSRISQGPKLIYLQSSPSHTGSERSSYFTKEGRDDIFTPIYQSSTRREAEPRHSTRQPFPIPATIVTAPSVRYKHSSDNDRQPNTYTTPNGRHNKVPASLFKEAYKSPRMPPGLGGELWKEEEDNASVNESVINNYLAPSPMVPPCLSPGILTPPGKLHVRKDTSPSFDFDKPLPSLYSEKEVYKVVEGVINSGRR